MGDNFTSNKDNKLYCKNCDFKCYKKGDWSRHILTRKHKKCDIMVTLDNKITSNYINYITPNECICGNFYKYKQGLSRHKKKCSVIKEKNTEQPTIDIDKELLIKMLLKNQDIMEGVILKNSDVMNKMMETMPQLGNNNNINSNNNNTNNFNIQMFLNEHCKDAMNLTDFIQSLPITNKTYDDTIENGLTKTITNMMVNGLNDLDILKRPIHCTDTKRKTLYVKESDIWERDNELIKILNGITEIAFKQRTMIKKWQEANEGWETIEKIQLKLTRLISNSMTSIEEDEKETNKIIRSISNKVYLDNDTKKSYV